MGRDYHSSANQRILGELVNREIIMCGTDIVEYSLRNCYETEEAPFTYNDIENNYRKVCPECGCELEEIDEDDIKLEHKWVCESCEERFDTKEEALKCCYEDEEDREGLDESDMVKEVWICPFCDDEYESEENAKKCICRYRETLYKCSYCEKHVLESEADEKANEVYEWWFVTNWFAEKLAAHGEVVIRGYMHSVWGRCCTGQAILLDWVVGKIAEEMEILEGMDHDWSKYRDL